MEIIVQRSCGCPILEVFKVCLDEALSNLVSWKLSLPKAGGLDEMIFKGPFPTQTIP